MTRRIKKLLAHKSVSVVVVVYTLLITLLFLMPKVVLIPVKTYIPFDKIGHTIIHLFLVFGWLLFFYRHDNKHLSISKARLIGLLCFFYGIIIEIIQELMIPLRQADFFDVLANTIGLFIGFTLFWKLKDKKSV